MCGVSSSLLHWTIAISVSRLFALVISTHPMDRLELSGGGDDNLLAGLA